MEHSIDSQIIKQLRIDNSWSQDKLAAASGLSLRTIQRIENEGVCSLESRQALAATFEVDSTVLSTGKKNMDIKNQILPGSKFDDVSLTNSDFVNVNLRQSKFVDINFSDTTFHDVNLRNSEITDANITGMKVNGYLLTELIEVYETSRE